MKNLTRFIVLLASFWAIPSTGSTIGSELISKITIESSDVNVGMTKNAFSPEVKQNFINSIATTLKNGAKPTIFGDTKTWGALSGDSTGTHLLRFALSAHKFTNGTLSVKGAGTSALFLNQEAITGTNEYKLKLINQDYSALLLVSGVESWQDFSLSWAENEDSDNAYSSVVFSNDLGVKRASLHQYFDSQSIASVNISPDGELLIWTKHAYNNGDGDKLQSLVEIIDLASQKVVYRWQAMTPQHITWSLDSKSLVFIHNDDLFGLTRSNWQLSKLAQSVKGIRSLDWLNESTLLVAWHKPEKEEHAFTKRYRALEDRWDYWRGNAQLQLFDMQSGLFTQITRNELTTSLVDIDVKNYRALIARSPVDYKEPPHSLRQLFSLDLRTGAEQLLGEYRTFGSAKFHTKGMIVQAGPQFFDGAGINTTLAQLPNNYDGQIYLVNHEGIVTALSKNFAPSISAFEVLNNGDLILTAVDQDQTRLYKYDMRRTTFEKLDTQVEVLSSVSFSKQNNTTIVYAGSSATIPQSVHLRTLNSSKSKTLFDSAKEDYANVAFIELKDWDYTTESGQAIDGRIYYPAGFDDSKKYPAIIYYYAGTVPVSRAYTGRWPFSLWASQGYVVYVVQPSGTIGYGQDFSARHVNAWGINTADEIIESTQAFVNAHPFVDENRLGNMGASYGGFMTMHLATKTDMFAASISHAGISNISSYWGYGWWGFGYSGIATTGSFPWNKTDFYTQQSPLFAADKVTTPMLLIHGDADTNVPVGESHQMYTALKLLGKDVELVEFIGDDHHINSRERRVRWWKTILAYFDKELKDEPQWWDELYPAPNNE